MTDLEMTRACAEAMGLRPEAGQGDKVPMWCLYERAVDGRSAGSVFGGFNPIHDDKQAMALVRRFELSLCAPSPDDKKWYALKVWTDHGGTISAHNENLNRAIVECVAKMQKGKA